MAEQKKIATRDSFGRALVELGKQHAEIVVMDADLAGATRSGMFKKEFPERFFDCGMLNFLILPEDLAARRWNQVKVYLHSA